MGAHTARSGWAALLNLVVQEGLPEQATYEQRLEMVKELNKNPFEKEHSWQKEQQVQRP